MLAVIDYGASNLRSVVHALNYLHVSDMRIVHNPHELRHADKIILPGVGAFGAGMQQLRAQGLAERFLCGAVDERVDQRGPGPKMRNPVDVRI